MKIAVKWMLAAIEELDIWEIYFELNQVNYI